MAKAVELITILSLLVGIMSSIIATGRQVYGLAQKLCRSHMINLSTLDTIKGDLDLVKTQLDQLSKVVDNGRSA